MDHIDILFRLFIAHFIGDFLLQSRMWANDRRHKKFRSKYLYLHVFIHGVLVYLILDDWSNFFLPLIIAGSHFIVDLGKVYIKEKPWFFFADQIIHIVILIFGWILFYSEFLIVKEWLDVLSENNKLWIILLSYVFIIWPAAVVIRILTEKYQPAINNQKADVEPGENEDSTIGLKDAGRFIGILERFLILTFILAQQYAIIGFLIAAKSVMRYSDIKSNTDRKRVEYILIGTFLSFSIAVLTGMLCLQIINNL